MLRILVALVCLLFLLPESLMVAADDSQTDSGTPAEQYAALLREYRPASGGMRGAETDLQRSEAVARMGSFAPRFLELAERYPEDLIALEALKQAVQIVGSTDSGAQIAWETNRADFPDGIPPEAAIMIVTLLKHDHVLSEDLGPVCDRMRYGYRMEYAEFLQNVVDENPHRDVQGIACLSLAQFLNDRLRMLQLTRDRPELTRRYETLFGDAYLPEIRQSARAARIEALFERAVEDFGDVELVFGGTVGAKAETELYEIRHLAVGMEAPDIAGMDQDGEQFKLSEYRGNVVLLYFWMEF